MAARRLTFSADLRKSLPAGLCAVLFFLPALPTAAGARSLLDASASCPTGAQACFTADGSTQYCCPANWGCCSGPDLTCYPQGQPYPSDPNDFVRNGFPPGTIGTASPVLPATSSPTPTPAATQSGSNPGSGSGTRRLTVTRVTDSIGRDFSNKLKSYEPKCPSGTIATGGGCQCENAVDPVNLNLGPVLVSNFQSDDEGWLCICPACPPSSAACFNFGTVACASLTF